MGSAVLFFFLKTGCLSISISKMMLFGWCLWQELSEWCVINTLQCPLFMIDLSNGVISMWALSVLNSGTDFRCVWPHLTFNPCAAQKRCSMAATSYSSALLLCLYVCGWDEVFPLRSTVKSPQGTMWPIQSPNWKARIPVHPLLFETVRMTSLCKPPPLNSVCPIDFIKRTPQPH